MRYLLIPGRQLGLAIRAGTPHFPGLPLVAPSPLTAQYSIVVTMSVAALVVGLLAASAEAKSRRTGVAPAAHSGTFVSAAGGKLVMTGDKGKEHSFPLAKNAKFTVDGKPGTLDAFKKAMHI